MKSIQSVQAQSYKNIEMIIIDDKSSDPRYTNDTLIQGVPSYHQQHDLTLSACKARA